jgi:4-diphosphocytidyl-2-C-methyl-D-erythritol kinase
VRAVELLRRRACITAGARLHLVKRIPVAAGLGGGSSDAAAALVAANLGWDLGWSGDELAELGSQLGSDVPFFLGRGTAICRGRGEHVVPIAGFGRQSFVVVKPPAGLSTSAVYARCRPDYEPRRVAPVVAGRSQSRRAGGRQESLGAAAVMPIGGAVGPAAGPPGNIDEDERHQPLWTSRAPATRVAGIRAPPGRPLRRVPRFILTIDR